VVDNALEAVVRIDAAGAVVGWNAQAERTFGWRADEAIGRPLDDLIVPPAARHAHRHGMQRLLAGGASTILNRRLELSALHRDGRELPVELAITPVRVGERQEFSAFIRDLSEVRQAESTRLALEAQLRESQKMEAIGTLAGGIAHDFNNIVGAILGHTALVRDELAPDHPVQGSLQHVHRAGIRARALVQQILAFSRREPQQLATRALAPVVEETLALLRSTLPAGAQLEASVSGEPLHALADATQLQQVLLNLCTNAWHALPDGRGRITVGLDTVTLGTHALRPGGLAPGVYARLTVSDDGCGMDAATRARVFEPFFTTKPVGQGTGLGLAVVHGIVQSHHGAITLDSAPGCGSVFTILLPRVEPQAAPAVSDWGVLDAVDTGHGEHVLCLDDDEVMLLLAQQLLTRAGYRVSCFQDAQAALDAFAAQPESFDVVVTDYNMPHLSGLDVAREILRLRAGLPVVVGSGDLSEALRAQAARTGVARLLHKENLFAELAAVVQQSLAQARTCSIG
jgi:PAS domain S-box-containing protein